MAKSSTHSKPVRALYDLALMDVIMVEEVVEEKQPLLHSKHARSPIHASLSLSSLEPKHDVTEHIVLKVLLLSRLGCAHGI